MIIKDDHRYKPTQSEQLNGAKPLVTHLWLFLIKLHTGVTHLRVIPIPIPTQLYSNMEEEGTLYGKRKKKRTRMPNPLFEMWLKEWKQEAADKGIKSQYVYAKVLHNDPI